MAGKRRVEPGIRLVGDWRTLDLRFTDDVGQSRMSRWFPDRLLVPYTRTMLGALWLAPRARDVGHVGLGGGSQVKFLHRHLPTVHQRVAEISGEVLALRGTFRVPADDDRLQIVQADAAAWLPQNPGAFDILLVDGYDARGLPQALSTPAFYAACRAALRDGGVLAVNLYDTDLRQHEQRLRGAFGKDAVTLLAEAPNQRVAFAWVGELQPAVPAALSWRGRWALRRTFSRLREARIGYRRGAA